jgi:hypothetical protein
MSPSDRSGSSGSAGPSGDRADPSGSSPVEPDLGDGRPTSSRRSFLGRAAVGAAAGGLVWAAPSILTVDAAAAASCGTGGTLNWANATPPGNPTSITVGTVVATIAHTDPNNVGSSPNFAVNTGTFGGQSSAWYQMQMEGAQTNQAMTVTFTFSKQVNGLTFQFFDIDQNADADTTGFYRDVVWVTGTNAANATVGTSATNLGSSVSGNGTFASPFLPNNGSSNATAGQGNARITFNGPVQTVTITYQARAPRRGNNTAYPYPNGAGNGWSSQRIGIGNMGWTGCT